MNKKRIIIPLIAASLFFSGCSVVKVSEAGKKVNIVSSNDVFNCTRIGTVTTSVLDNVLFIPRNEEKVQIELDKLARDEAVIMKANTLVRVSTEEGQGNYIAYSCP